MKKLLLAAVTFMLLSATAYACQTQTIIVNGKITVCTVCGSVVNCFKANPKRSADVLHEERHPLQIRWHY